MSQLLAQATFTAPVIDWWSAAVFLTPLVGALVVLLYSRLSPREVPYYASTILTVLTGVLTAGFSFRLWGEFTDHGTKVVLGGAIVLDGFAIFVMLLSSLVVIVAALFVEDFAPRVGLAGHEMYALILSSVVGAMVMGSAADFITFFVGLETLSLGLYVLAAMNLRRSASQESAMKYFLLGAFASAVLLYGIALVYGATGTTNLIQIADFLGSTLILKDALLLAGVAMILVGLAFKVSAAPFHMWAPDAYQGAPSPIAGYMAAMAKIGGFAAMARILTMAFGSEADVWQPAVAVLATLSLLVGAYLAIVQSDVKRMLAYSSIAHAGFILVAVQTNTVEGTSAVLFYIFTYAFMVLGSFGILSLISGDNDKATTIDDLAGLAKRRPALAFGFAMLLLSQAGVPLTAGFVAKFQAIQVAVVNETYWLAIVAMLSAVVAAYLYLRIIGAMYMTEGESDGDVSAISATGMVAVVIVVLITIGFGIVPGPLVDFADDALLLVVP